MLIGLANSLQCDKREAFRIALYEIALIDSQLLADAIECARSTTKVKGHTSRSTKTSLNLPSEDRATLMMLAQTLSITDKELVRASVIFMSRGIKSEQLTSLTGSKKISQESLARKWSRENKGQPSKLSNLHKARDEAYKAAAEAGRLSDKALYQARGAKMRELGINIDTTGFEKNSSDIDLTMIDALIACDDQSLVDRLVEKEAVRLSLSEKEQFIYRWMLQYPDFTDDELEELWRETQNLEIQSDLEEDYECDSFVYSSGPGASQRLNAEFSAKLQARRRWFNMSYWERHLKSRLDKLFDDFHYK